MALPAGEAFNLLARSEVLTPVAGVVSPSVPAMSIWSAFDRTNGVYLAITAPEVVAGAGSVAVAANGGVTVDPACLSVELVYVAAEGTIVTETVQVVASVATFLAGKTGIKVLSATVLAGIVLGAKATVKRATAPAATKVALSALGTGVTFNVADVVNGSASITYLARPSRSIGASLNGAVNFS
jgi:hypothetical protein